jgi:CheY-like chemotaxis protein
MLTGSVVGGVRTLENLLVILVVEDDRLIQSLVEEVLADGSFEPAIAPSGVEEIESLCRLRICSRIRSISARMNVTVTETPTALVQICAAHARG